MWEWPKWASLLTAMIIAIKYCCLHVDKMKRLNSKSYHWFQLNVHHFILVNVSTPLTISCFNDWFFCQSLVLSGGWQLAMAALRSSFILVSRLLKVGLWNFCAKYIWVELKNSWDCIYYENDYWLWDWQKKHVQQILKPLEITWLLSSEYSVMEWRRSNQRTVKQLYY